MHNPYVLILQMLTRVALAANMLSDMFCDPLPLNARLELLREDQPDKVRLQLATATDPTLP